MTNMTAGEHMKVCYADQEVEKILVKIGIKKSQISQFVSKILTWELGAPFKN